MNNIATSNDSVGLQGRTFLRKNKFQNKPQDEMKDAWNSIELHEHRILFGRENDSFQDSNIGEQKDLEYNETLWGKSNYEK